MAEGRERQEEAVAIVGFAFSEERHGGGETFGSLVLKRAAVRIAPRAARREWRRLEDIYRGDRQEEESGWWNAR